MAGKGFVALDAAERASRLKKNAGAGTFPTPEGDLSYLGRPKTDRMARSAADRGQIQTRQNYERTIPEAGIRRGKLHPDEVRD